MIHKIKTLHDEGRGLSIRAIGQELGLSRKKVSIHPLRHSYAPRLMGAGLHLSGVPDAASAVLTQLRRNHKQSLDLGLCAVLHTHARNLIYHPHVHVIVPGGGVSKKRRQWRKLKGRYLFNARNLATVFRAKLLAELNRAGVKLPGLFNGESGRGYARPIPICWLLFVMRPHPQHFHRFLFV